MYDPKEEEKELALKNAIIEIENANVSTPAAMLVSHGDKKETDENESVLNVIKNTVSNDTSNSRLMRKASMLHPYSGESVSKPKKDPKVNKLRKLFGF